MIRGCCDDPDCSYCHGSGIVETTEQEELAIEILLMASISDLNEESCRDAIRRLCQLILGKGARSDPDR